MRVVRSSAEVRAALRAARAAGARRLALIPTSGALHRGHLSLVQLAKAQADYRVVSLFVNPTQFGPTEDFAAYPRDEERDRRLLEEQGVELLFTPPVEDIYPQRPRLGFEISGLADHLCGARRPGHFNGVLLIVAKLFNLIRPEVAVFGMKDLQQLVIIKQLVRELSFDIQIVAAPTVREPDGLALSSRNRYLNPEERRQSSALYRALERGQALIAAGERQAERVIVGMSSLIAAEAPLARLDYLEIVDLATLQPLKSLSGRCALALAAYFGQARLIDNLVLEVGGEEVHELPAI